MGDSRLSPAIPQLPSGNLEETAEFFTKRLGFTVSAKFPDFKLLILKREAAEIHFWQTATEEEAQKLGQMSSCYIRVENIEPLFVEFQKRENVFRYELRRQPWGMMEMQIDDPYGNAIRFGEALN